VVAVAIALGAWLSLADLLEPPGNQSGPGTAWYSAIAAVGVVVVAVIAGWHALWLIPVASCSFAAVYERWLWDEPAGIPGGMDGIGYAPSGVVWGMVFVVPFTALVLASIAGFKWCWRKRTAATTPASATG